MKRILLISVFLILGIQSGILSQQYITPQQLGLTLSKGNIDKSKMSSQMKDIPVIDIFSYGDEFFNCSNFKNKF